MKGNTLEKRIKDSFKKYGWTEEQQKVFRVFVGEKYANYSSLENTLNSYLSLLNYVVDYIKKPFSNMTYSDNVPILKNWQENHSEATVHGWKCKMKAFFRWESENKNDPRVEKIRVGSYVSPITIHDLLTDDEIVKLRDAAKADSRDIAMVDFHLLWGLRLSEIAKLKVRDIEIHDEYIVVNIPQTKIIYRPVPIPLTGESVIQDVTFFNSALNSYTSLMQYLNIHPGYPADPDYPLWYDEKKGRKHLDKYSLSRIFKRVGKEAELKQNISTLF